VTVLEHDDTSGAGIDDVTSSIYLHAEHVEASLSSLRFPRTL